MNIESIDPREKDVQKMMHEAEEIMRTGGVVRCIDMFMDALKLAEEYQLPQLAEKASRKINQLQSKFSCSQKIAD